MSSSARKRARSARKSMPATTKLLPAVDATALCSNGLLEGKNPSSTPGRAASRGSIRLHRLLLHRSRQREPFGSGPSETTPGRRGGSLMSDLEDGISDCTFDVHIRTAWKGKALAAAAAQWNATSPKLQQFCATSTHSVLDVKYHGLIGTNETTQEAAVTPAKARRNDRNCIPEARNSSMVLVTDFKSAALTLEAAAARRASLSDAATKMVSRAPATGSTTS